MFSPCMRSDVKITQTISLDRQEENRTGCCISLDKSGCVQRSRLQCSETFSLFHKWSATKPSSTSRTSGPVCGEDPRTCKVPASVKPFQWPDDITKWPSCSRMLSVNYSRERMPHMTCRVLGRPCCIGRFGKCEIVSAEYCNYRRGTYHRNAFLCSQVNCLESSCGLVKFLNPTVPDQFYRFWISLFLHAGLLHLGVTLLFNLIILKDFEKMAGWLRISIIYVLSGIGGNIISGILLPYHPEIGPSGSNFGIVACLFVEVFQSWQILKRPVRAIGKLAVIVLVLFVFGLLPYVDNFSHFGGFIFGLFLAFAILPYVSFGKWDRRRKRLQIIISIFIVGGLFCAILFIFYRGRPFECKVCRYLNCIPFTDHFCKNLGQKLELF
ncbi:Inactive rhomboid protein 1 [Trichoplax sp. H2]|nr:Inactive rhomboid protein 1 [Trichoplax sp. H2]|eukprot:RDD43903.1 Inactive rhomboid protein 1 [Trichoplax sp. H2]